MTEGLCLGSSVEGPGQGPVCIRTEAARAHLLCASCLFQLENPLRNCSDCISATRRCVSGMGVCVLGVPSLVEGCLGDARCAGLR